MSAIVRAAIKLSIGIVIYFGLPLTGWGLHDLQGFFAHPARLGYTILTVLMLTVIVIVLPDAGSNRGKGIKTVNCHRISLILIQLISLGLLFAAPFLDRRNVALFGDIEAVRYLGLALYVLGVILMHWAEVALGEQFSVEVTIREGHKLVTSGPFRYLRHPRYLGVILMTAGISLVFNSWLALFPVAALALLLIWRIRDEDALLRGEFGAEWEAYAKRSWRLVPFVY
jgi:protein-S-isoprenylcysteine O-methyltransferase Ste14